MYQVLDNKGYIKLINNMGSDLDIVNAARVSFNREVTSLDSKDLSLINYIVKNKHDSCLRHCVMSFEIYAPLMVARQWYKHAVASAHVEEQLGWNETSRRYVTEDEQFYIPMPDEWRSAADNKKQGSGPSVGTYKGAKYYQYLNRIVRESLEIYKEALADGIAPEQARLLLPAYAMYVRWRWTASLNSVLHFVSLRLDNHAQYEIQEYAKIINSIVEEHYPVTSRSWNDTRVKV